MAAREASRFGILGDIHAEDGLLRVALAHFAASDVDTVLAVGDIVDGPGSVDACCDALRASHVLGVRGNHERWFLGGEMRQLPDATPVTAVSAETRAFLEDLPVTRRIPTIKGTLLLCHGTDEEDMVTVRPDDYGYGLEVNDPLQRLIRSGDVAMVVCGHSHQRMVRGFGGLTIINAGTLHRKHSPCFGVIDLVGGKVTFFERVGEAAVTLEVLPL
jgi:predicted phosphodiesterase